MEETQKIQLKAKFIGLIDDVVNSYEKVLHNIFGLFYAI